MEQIIVELINKSKITDVSILVLTSLSLLINIVSVIFIQSFSSRTAYKSDAKKIKMERKLNHIELLYKDLIAIQHDSFQLNDGKTDELSSKIKKIRIYISHHKILLSKKICSKTEAILDYYDDIIANPNRRNQKEENTLLDNFIKEYESL